jgi:uncharacterized protein YbjT (DUF2867 family)
VAQLIHVSAIGAEAQSPSAYGRSKAAGEAAVRAAFPKAVILRPSILFGAEDDFFNRFAAMAVTLPVIPIVHGSVKLQPVYVDDVAAAVLAARAPEAEGRLYELGGLEVRSFRELVELTLKYIRRHRRILDLPVGLARLLALLPGVALTNDQIDMLSRDSLAAPGTPGLAEMGIVPTGMELVLPLYLGRYCVGGKGAGAVYQE